MSSVVLALYGIVIAIAVIIILMLFWFLFTWLGYKRNTNEISLESEVIIDRASQKPIIPRQVRDQYFQHAKIVLDPLEDETNQTSSSQATKQETSTTQTTPETTNSNIDNIDDELPETPVVVPFSDIETKRIDKYQGTSSVLANDLSEHESHNEKFAHQPKTQVIEFFLFIHPNHILSGKDLLKKFQDFGLQYGELNYFHRYQPDGRVLQHMFTVGKREHRQTVPFDLNTLPKEQIKDLSFSLRLPHYDAPQAYDIMMSTMQRFVKDYGGHITDKNGNKITAEKRIEIRQLLVKNQRENQF